MIFVGIQPRTLRAAMFTWLELVAAFCLIASPSLAAERTISIALARSVNTVPL